MNDAASGAHRPAWVFSSYVNAWSLRAALTQLGRSLHVCAPDGLLRGGARQPEHGDTLFFTEEASLAEFLPKAALFHFLPRHLPEDVLDDKPGLTRLAVKLGLPVVTSLDLDVALRKNAVPFPFLLKSAGSWRNGRNLPRGWVCPDRAALDRALDEIAAAGFARSDFFAQEWLGETAPNDSVCGFFDARHPARNLMVVAKRRLNDRPSLACSAVVEVVGDPGGLTACAERLLREIDFTGPFELEFVRDAAGQFRLLELNPRFWLQHGMFLPFGNGVVRRYLELDQPAAPVEAIPPGTTWVNGVWLAQQIFRGRWRQAYPWFKHRPRTAPRRLIVPDLRAAMGFLIRRRLRQAGPESVIQWNR
jgi:hypothetical protein